MTCANCQRRIEGRLRNTAGIEKVFVSYERGCAEVTYDTDLLGFNDVSHIVETLGYQVAGSKKAGIHSIVYRIGVIAVIFVLYVLLQSMGILTLLAPGQLADNNMGYGMLFVIGLITSVHCIAMCGGINLSQCLLWERKTGKETKRLRAAAFRPALLYNLGRVISYTVTGLVLGLAGFLMGGAGEVGMSVVIQGFLKIFAGICMVVMGINMLDLFPGLRRFTLRMPESVVSGLRKQKVKSRGPFYVGLLNGLMPCGPLQ